MWLVYTAMRRPITILVAVLTVALASWLAIRGMKVDIFPQLGAPAIYVAQPYGGMDPSQMEGYLPQPCSPHLRDAPWRVGTAPLWRQPENDCRASRSREAEAVSAFARRG